jgi:hypothetical protein
MPEVMGARVVADAIAFDQPTCLFVKHLIESSSLAEKIDCIDFPDRRVIEFHRRETLPFDLWSSGEQSVWEFLASLAGHGQVNLAKLARHVGGSGRLAADLMTIFDVAMGGRG